MIERHNVVEDQHLEYLDELRESGATNMFGAASFVRERFGIPITDAKKILVYWMQTFEERHKGE